MTINEAIARADRESHNTIPKEEKIRWLSDIDGIIKLEIIDTHEGAEGVEYKGYTEDTPLDTVLIVSEPWSDVYIKYLEMKIAYAHAEYDKYNNATLAYNSAYTAFAKWYNRTHMPKGAGFKY